MSQRIGYLDVAKFIGLALVCFCHIPMPTGNFHAWIYSFHMPLFFLLSGIFFNPDKFSLKKVSIQLLLPFVLFNFLAIVINICLNFIIDRTLEFPRFNLMNGLMGEYVIGPSWFLLSLFTIRIFCSYMYKYAKMFGLLIGIILLLLVFLYTRETNIWNVLNIGSTVLGLPFYLMGFISKDIMIGNINCGGWIVTILLTLISCLAMCNGLVGIHAHLYGDNLFAFFFFGWVGTIMLVRWSLYIPIPRRIVNVFMQGAMFYICMYTLMFEYMLLVWNKLTGDFSGNTLTEKIVVTLLTLVISYPIIRFMLRYTPILLGKQVKNECTI